MSDPLRFPADPPRIAVAPRLFAGACDAAGAWRRQQLFFEQTLLERLLAAGALIVGTCLPRSAALARRVAQAYADDCDGLVLQGGTNLGAGPAREELTALDHARDRFEYDLLAAFVAADKPVIGICRGMQLINVAFGGTLQALPEVRATHHSDPAIYHGHSHAVELVAAGYLAGLYEAQRGVVSSAHRQATLRIGAGLDVEAVCLVDAQVEAIRSTAHRYVVGVQWHPEFDHAAQGRLCGARLLRDFVANARIG